MNKCRIIVFITVLLFSIYKIIDNKILDIEDNVYIVSEKEDNEKETTSNSMYKETDNQIQTTKINNDNPTFFL